jgi:hypothetical protein
MNPQDKDTGTTGDTSRNWGWITILGRLYVVCYPSPSAQCHVIGLNADGSYGLVAPKETSTFHDETLAEATKEINSILTRIVRENSEPNRGLHFIQVPNGLLLAWGVEVADKQDEDSAVEQILGI